MIDIATTFMYVFAFTMLLPLIWMLPVIAFRHFITRND